MTPRERMLAIVALCLIVLFVGTAGGYFPIYSPLQSKKQTVSKLQIEVDDLQSKVGAMQKASPQAAAIKRASLPPDHAFDPKDPGRVPTYNFAVAEYKRLLQYLLTRAGIADGRPTSDNVNVKALGTP